MVSYLINSHFTEFSGNIEPTIIMYMMKQVAYSMNSKDGMTEPSLEGPCN